MAIAFVLDENLRGKPLWHAIRHHNFAGGPPIDATRVGDRSDLLGSRDKDIRIRAERADRIVLTEDACGFSSPAGWSIRSGSVDPNQTPHEIGAYSDRGMDSACQRDKI